MGEKSANAPLYFDEKLNLALILSHFSSTQRLPKYTDCALRSVPRGTGQCFANPIPKPSDLSLSPTDRECPPRG